MAAHADNADQLIEGTSYSFSRSTPVAGERRKDQRHLTILRVGTLVVGDRRELCLIRNISCGGLMAHVYSALGQGDRVAVELKGNQPLVGKVVWIEGSTAGIEFESTIDVEELLAAHRVLDNGWIARMPRVEVDRLAQLRIGARIYPVSTLDISQGGVKIEIDEAIEPGRDAVLILDGFRSMPCAVRWYKDGRAGISFNQVIPFHDLMGWLRRS
jgi:hypothetical protein